jgi:acyl dehydratase
MGPVPIPSEAVIQRVGSEVGVSRWVEITQSMIDGFADTTMDRQFIHVDADRAAATPFGGAIAHGFLLLALLSAMSYDAVPRIEGAEIALNYGMNRVRFLAPVRAGRRVRGRFVLAAAEPRGEGRLLLTWDAAIEIEGEDKPALVAQWLTLTVLSSGFSGLAAS